MHILYISSSCQLLLLPRQRHTNRKRKWRRAKGGGASSFYVNMKIPQWRWGNELASSVTMNKTKKDQCIIGRRIMSLPQKKKGQRRKEPLWRVKRHLPLSSYSYQVHLMAIQQHFNFKCIHFLKLLVDNKYRGSHTSVLFLVNAEGTWINLINASRTCPDHIST